MRHHPAPDPSTHPDPGPAATSDEPSGDRKPETRAQRRARRGGTRYVFVDTEATGLDHARHELTEVAWIVRLEDGSELERVYYPEHTTDGADADALTLTRYDDRIATQATTPAREWLAVFLDDAQDAVIVGAVPDFDVRHLERMCRKLELTPTWDHHLLDVETLALPLLAGGPEPPRSLAKTCKALGVAHDKDQAHGALYDARQAMRAFDAVWALLADLRADERPLPPPVPRREGEPSSESDDAARSSAASHDAHAPASGAEPSDQVSTSS